MRKAVVTVSENAQAEITILYKGHMTITSQALVLMAMEIIGIVSLDVKGDRFMIFE